VKAMIVENEAFCANLSML